MFGSIAMVDKVRHALHSQPRVHPTTEAIRLLFDGGTLTMEGEVDHIAGKKMALQAAARVPGVAKIVDRLRVRPATPMGDGEIRDKVRDALLEETVLASCNLRIWNKGNLVPVRQLPDAVGTIDVRVEDGVVTLDGVVVGAGQQRLAGVLAWWVPASRDVINNIRVSPPEEDSEAGIAEAVLQVLEKDPFVNAESIQVSVRGAVVTLEGTVPRQAERKLAEDDAWYVFDVDNVINQLSVHG